MSEMDDNKPACTKCGKHPAKEGSELCGYCGKKSSGIKKRKHDFEIVGVSVDPLVKNKKITLQLDLEVNVDNIRIVS